MVLQVTNKIIAVVSRELVDIVTKPIPPPTRAHPHISLQKDVKKRGDLKTLLVSWNI